MFKKLARPLTRWHNKLKHWHATWHVATFLGTLARTNEKLARFWHMGMQARWHINHTSTQARWYVDHAGTQARCHVDHVGTLGTRLSKLDEKQKQPPDYSIKKLFLKIAQCLQVCWILFLIKF